MKLQAAEGRLNKAEEPFSIRRKDFYNIEHAQWILEKLTPKITHETDGLLFQPSKDVSYKFFFTFYWICLLLLSILFMIDHCIYVSFVHLYIVYFPS